MHVVVVGCGRVGSGLAIGLVQQGHTVSIIDRNARAFRRLPTEWPGTAIVGSGFDRDDLDRAKAGDAGALAAVTSGDNTNILTARIARETYEIPHVVARIYDPRRAQIYLRLGIPTVATVSWTIDQVQRRLIPASKSVEWSDTTGTLSLVERALPERWAGKRLSDMNTPGELTVVSVTRAGVARLDIDELVGQDGDVLHLVLTNAARQRFDARAADESGTDHGARSGDGDTVVAGVPVPRAELDGEDR